jgi:hypothetical protein
VPCLIFRGAKKFKGKRNRWRIKARAKEEAEYKKVGQGDVLVLWQPKAWADLSTCVEWTEKGLGYFVCNQDELKELQGDAACLLLVDNLSGQVKKEFATAAARNGKCDVMYGPRNATHLWQPVDHHVGARYKNRMGEKYDNWMATVGRGLTSIPVMKRRILLVKWAGEVYRELEAERKKREAAVEEDSTADPSLFYRAFLRPGMLVVPHNTEGGPSDKDIRPHADIKGKVDHEFRRQLALVLRSTVREREEDWRIEVSSSDSDSEGSEDNGVEDRAVDSGADDSEDEDDEELEDSDGNDGGEREELDGGMVLEVPDEGAMMQRAAEQAKSQGELKDFVFAQRVAKSSGLLGSSSPRFILQPNPNPHKRRRTKRQTN